MMLPIDFERRQPTAVFSPIHRRAVNSFMFSNMRIPQKDGTTVREIIFFRIPQSLFCILTSIAYLSAELWPPTPDFDKIMITTRAQKVVYGTRVFLRHFACKKSTDAADQAKDSSAFHFSHSSARYLAMIGCKYACWLLCFIYRLLQPRYLD